MDTTYARLLSEIKEKSKKGTISWSPSSFVNTFEAPLGTGSIMITHDTNPTFQNDSSPIASLSFINERGEVFHSIESMSILDAEYSDLKEIYDSAYENYMKIGETLKSMFDDLKNR